MKTISTITLGLLLMMNMHAQEWKQLFNGKDLSGWEQVGPGSFVVEDGSLKTVGGMGLLLYQGEKFGNVVLKIEYNTASGHDNAGVHIRMPEKPEDPWEAVNKGYEVQIDNGMRFLHDDYHCTGVLYSFSKALAYPQYRPGEWNIMEITMDGPTTTVHVNGKKVTQFTEGDEHPIEKRWFEPDRGPRPESGYIGLQNHDEESVVYFRSVAIKELE